METAREKNKFKIFYKLKSFSYIFFQIFRQDHHGLPLDASAGDSATNPPALANRVSVGLYTCHPKGQHIDNDL